MKLSDTEKYLLELIGGAGAIGIDINGIVVRVSQANVSMTRPQIQSTIATLVRLKRVGLDTATGNYFAK